MKIKQFLPIIGIAIFIYLLIKLKVSDVLVEISNVKINFLLIALIFLILSLLLQTFKWFIIARKQNVKVSFSEAIKIQLISSFYGFITPARLGQVMRANYLKKYSKNNLGKGVGNFVLEKILDLCSLIFLVIIASFFFKEIVSIGYLFPAILFGLFVVMLFIVMNEKYSKKIFGVFEKIAGKFIPKKLKDRAKESFYSFHEDKPKRRYLLLFFLINLISWIFLYAVSFFIGRAVGIEVSFFYFMAILPVTTLISQIPITISGLGTREITMIGLFGLLGVDATKVFSMSIIGLFLGDVIPAIIGFFLSLKKEK